MTDQYAILSTAFRDVLPLAWDDVTYARAGTGRAELSEHDRATLGTLADRRPLFG
jgi:hypothetical protein